MSDVRFAVAIGGVSLPVGGGEVVEAASVATAAGLGYGVDLGTGLVDARGVALLLVVHLLVKPHQGALRR